MRSTLFLIVILSMFFVSCAKENVVDTRVYVDIPKNLVGNWNWVSTSGGIAGSLSTPETTGETRRVEFDDNSNFRYYVNDILKSDHTFKIEKSRSITGNDSALIAYSLLSPRQSIMFRGSDTLILFDECFDCYEHYFIRIK
jgi:hypothetical protein